MKCRYEGRGNTNICCLHKSTVLDGGGFGGNHGLHDAIKHTGCVEVEHSLEPESQRQLFLCHGHHCVCFRY